jgi:hypothetical protein
MPGFGGDYPQQIEQDGQVFNLERETRWNRRFSSDDGKLHVHISRLEDGSATISPDQLEAEWNTWSENEKWDFCETIHWLPQTGRERICRFLKEHASAELLHNNIFTVAANIPASETVPWLAECIKQRPPGTASNYLQALAHTKAPEAVRLIQRRLEEAFNSPDFIKDDPFLNWIAAEGLHCIEYLIGLNSPPSEFRSQALRLARHPCERIRKNFDLWLRKHYVTDAEFRGDA